MPSRFASLIAAVLLLLSLSTAQAGELQRRITLQNGDVHTGIIVERGVGYVVIQREDGTAIELALDAIDQIEVLATSAQPSEQWAPRPQSDAPDWADLRSVERPRYNTDWADEFDDDENMESLRTRYDQAQGAYAVSLAPTIPLMSIGLIQIASGPMLIGGYNTGVRAGVGAVGTVLLGGSVGTSVAGALLARHAYGSERSPMPLRFGVALGLVGTAGYVASFALTHSIWAQEVESQNGAEAPAVATLIGLSLGAVVAGDMILMADAKVSRDKVSREYRDSKRRWRSGHTQPELLAVWGTPTSGGFSGGVALQW